MLKIGVTACFMYPDPHRVIFGPKTLLYMGHDMSHFLGLKGVMPILIPDLPCEEHFTRFLDELDGFLFQGGTDVNPELYGQEPKNFRWAGDPQRDFYELKILKYAVEKEKPVLGVCRGMHLINVHFKGCLYQDLATMAPGGPVHYHQDFYDEHTHKVEFVEGGLFKKLYGDSKDRVVNSVHHQGINSLGEGLQVEAKCPCDGVVEAISYTKSKRPGLITGIQWHPEFFHTTDKETIQADPILDHFLQLCREK